MKWQDGSAAIQWAWQGHVTWSAEDELLTEAAALRIVVVATEVATGTVSPAQPDELPTEAAALRIVEVATEVATGTVSSAQPGPAEWSAQTSELLGQRQPAPDELPTEAAALRIVEVATEVAMAPFRLPPGPTA